MNATLAPDPWTINADDFPAMGSSTDKLHFLLQYAVLAPSSHNSQPWLFRVRGDEVELYADRTRALRVADPEDRELIISCGAALCHLRIAMRHFGYLGQMELFPDLGDPDLLARVRLGAQTEHDAEQSLMFHAIAKRRTNRLPFARDPVPAALLLALEREAYEESGWLCYVRGEEARCEVADLVAEGDRTQWADKKFRLELSAWVHSNQSTSRDGIPGYAEGRGTLLSAAGPLVVRTFDLGEGRAARDRDIAVHSPVLAVLGTNDDTPCGWLAAGQALARILLRARVEDVWASFLNQPIEVPELRSKLSHTIGHGGYPQILLRFGFGRDVKPTPRRLVDEVLI
ncbi:MAG: nitroreductase [Verrucomicrobiota bacterium]